MRGSNCSDLTGKILVFWIGGRLREVFAYWGSIVSLCTLFNSLCCSILDLLSYKRSNREKVVTVTLISYFDLVVWHKVFLFSVSKQKSPSPQQKPEQREEKKKKVRLVRYLCCVQTLCAKHEAFVEIATGCKRGKQMYWYSMEQLVYLHTINREL